MSVTSEQQPARLENHLQTLAGSLTCLELQEVPRAVGKGQRTQVPNCCCKCFGESVAAGPSLSEGSEKGNDASSSFQSRQHLWSGLAGWELAFPGMEPWHHCLGNMAQDLGCHVVLGSPMTHRQDPRQGVGQLTSHVQKQIQGRDEQGSICH